MHLTSYNKEANNLASVHGTQAVTGHIQSASRVGVQNLAT